MITKEICDSKHCTGCGSCTAVCPKSSIKMQINEIGAIQPVIDKKTCIDCNACRNICPVANEKKLKFNEAIEAYYATSIDKDIYSNASSGGVATQLAYEVLKMGGVVYASVMDANNIQALHVRIADEDTLRTSQKSKYVQSRVDIYIYISLFVLILIKIRLFYL